MRTDIKPIRLASAALAALVVSGAAADARAQQPARGPSEGLSVVVRTSDLRPAAAPAEGARSWTGKAVSPAPGRVTLTLDRVGMPVDPLHPVWPVSASWQLNSESADRSFSAELYGGARENGAMHLRGVITSGYRAGSEVELKVLGSGRGATLIIYPMHAAR